MMIASLAEPAMLMIVFTLALLAGSTQLSTIAGLHAGARASACGCRSALALVALIMVAIAENARIPVDNPATHLELTMVHEAMVLEYSGRHLALIEAAAPLKLLLYVSLIACVFVPVGHGAVRRRTRRPMSIGARRSISPSSRSAASCWRVFETAIAKMRVFRVPDFLGAALMLGLLGHAPALRVAERLMDAASPSTSPTCSPASWCW